MDQGIRFRKKKYTRISIFMNVFNCHVNRVPSSGKITKIFYKPGKYINATLDKASEENERNYVKMINSNGDELILVQIAGMIARRIVCDVKENDETKQGDRFGMIRFGSRVDLYFENYQLIVRKNQKTIAGETIIAKKNKNMLENKKEFKLISKKNPRSLLPNTLTIFGVCLGLSSIKFALDTNYAMAVIAIGFAAILDTLDGRVARLIKGTSKVGKELDSLTDVISFGVAPSFIMYFWTLNEIGKFGWMFVLIYTVCCALRLARFNLTVIEENETWKINFFEGVPSPAAAGLVLLPLILSLSGLVQFENTAILSSITILTTSILMVSKIPTYSLKRILIPRHLAIFLLLGIGIYVSLLIFYTFETLFFSGLIYIF